ncbi:aryl-sulfate sulfotransferase [Flavobacterium sp.]|uniref:aryl-sulfate sulfotransferase n=1 Tax=Flavobacterium sp. TaxID=239 RepID=UPI0038FD07E6
MKNILLFISVIFFFSFANAQSPTIGLLYHDTNVSDGYVLFSPLINNEVFLINTCGEKVHQWAFNEAPGATCYLLNNGNLLRAGKNNLEIRDWNNNIVWTYATTANGIQQHHDITPLPNGNILCIVSDFYTATQMTAAGKNPTSTTANTKLEKIIEIQPIGTNSAAVVWEWKFFNHLVQDFDATKSNYGVVENHPELLDPNFNYGNVTDYVHSNGIDYNPILDQILISSRHLSEIFIIDHSTTTAQAAGHTGGNLNKGGDFLWRWGNPQVYRHGTEADRKLFMQHNPMWVENDYLDTGKISVFNNGAPNSAQIFSTVVLLTPEISNGNYTMTNSIFNPSSYDWSWGGDILGVTLNQERQSGTQAMPNGNMIISEAITGRVSEMTKTGTLLWSYKNPTGPIVSNLTTYYNQFDIPTSNSFFKAEKYPNTFIGFVGHDLTPLAILEDVNTISSNCSTLGIPYFSYLDNIKVQNPSKNNLIQFNSNSFFNKISIYDLKGRLIFEQENFSDNHININLKQSIYLLKIEKESYTKTMKLIVQD